MPAKLYALALSHSSQAARLMLEHKGIDARVAEVSDERVRADVAGLPAQLDHIDRLIADGVIGGEQPNAADFQIAPTVRVFLDIVQPRPAGELAMRLLPRYPGPLPPFLPPEWLAAVRPAVVA